MTKLDRRSEPEGIPPASPRAGSAVIPSPSFASGAPRGTMGYQLPEEELCRFESSLSVGRVHACSQLLNNQSSDPYPKVPAHLLLTPHEPGSHVLISFNTDCILNFCYPLRCILRSPHLVAIPLNWRYLCIDLTSQGLRDTTLLYWLEELLQEFSAPNRARLQEPNPLEISAKRY